MPATFKFADLTGQTCYGLLLNEAGQVWNGAAFVAYNEPDFAAYDLPAVEYGTSGTYRVDLPAVAAGVYTVVAKRRAGGAPAPGDLTVWQEEVEIGWSGGTGARTVTVTVDDGVDPVENATVRLTKGSESYVRTTDDDGTATFQVDDGTWAVAITASGFDSGATSLVVDGSESLTVSLSATSLPPSAAGMVTGYLYAYDSEGVPEPDVSASVYASGADDAPAGLALEGTVRTETSDAEGLITFTNLIKGVTYTLSRGMGVGKEFTIPTDWAEESYNLGSVIGEP